METSKLPVTQPDGRFVTDQSEVCDFTQSQINVLVICGERRALRFIITSAGPTSPTLQTLLGSPLYRGRRLERNHQTTGNQRAGTLTWLMCVCRSVIIITAFQPGRFYWFSPWC